MADIAVPRVCDSVLLKIFLDDTLFEKDKLKLSDVAFVSFTIGVNAFIINANDTDLSEFINELRNEQGYCSKINGITFSDKTMNANCVFSYNRSSTSLIDIFKTPDKQVNEPALRLVSHVNNLILSHATDIPPNTDSEIASIHNDVLTRLEGLSANLITKQHEQAQQLEQDKQKFLDERSLEFVEKVNAQDEAYEEKLKELEDKYKVRNEQLDERQQQIDDADNTTARRKTTTKTLEEAQEKAKQFNFSDNVNRLSLKHK